MATLKDFSGENEELVQIIMISFFGMFHAAGNLALYWLDSALHASPSFPMVNN